MLKTLKTNPSRYLIAFDFDGTIAKTNEASPSGMDVSKAYALAIQEIFGKNAREKFESEGLQNRAPLEIVESLKDDSETSSYKLTHELVMRKLSYLLNEVGIHNGRVWPEPTKGLVELLKIVTQLRNEGNPIDVAIISSGHRAFIEKTLDTWNVPHPDILVTDDDIRDKPYPTELSRKVKPGQFPLAFAHHKWLKLQGLLQEDAKTVEEGRETKQRIVYIGDDRKKDLQMAKEGRIYGVLFPETSFEMIAENLRKNKDLMDGRPITEIIPPTSSRPEGTITLRRNERL